MFHYVLTMRFICGGKSYQLARAWESRAQLHAGDKLEFDTLGQVTVERVSWSLSNPSVANVGLEDHLEGGRSADWWEIIKDEFDGSDPPMAADEKNATKRVNP